MNAVALGIYIEVQAVLVEVEGMKAENAMRANAGHSMAYGEAAFAQQASKLYALQNLLTQRFQEGFAE